MCLAKAATLRLLVHNLFSSWLHLLVVWSTLVDHLSGTVCCFIKMHFLISVSYRSLTLDIQHCFRYKYCIISSNFVFSGSSCSIAPINMVVSFTYLSSSGAGATGCLDRQSTYFLSNVEWFVQRIAR